MKFPIKSLTQTVALALCVIACIPHNVLSFAPSGTLPAAGQLEARKQVWQVYTTGGNTWVYLLYLPKGYDANSSKVWPMITFFSTLGGTNDMSPNYNELINDKSPYTQTNGGPANYLRTPETCTYVSDSFIVLTPWYAYGQLMPCASDKTPNYTAYLGPLYQHLKSTVKIDTLRMHAMGYCLGAAVGYRYATIIPNIYASVSMWSVNDGVNSCTDLTKLSILDNTALRLYHGSEDPYVNIAIATAMSNAINARSGSRTKPYVYTEVVGARHECWNDGGHVTDTVKALYDWMLAQKRSGGTTVVSQDIVQKTNGSANSWLTALSNSSRIETVDLSGKRVSIGNAQQMRTLQVVRAWQNGKSVVRKVIAK